jgi:PIN domain nuclease of toxin-antitoxin system
MRILLDTHSFLWFIMGSPKLSSKAHDEIESQDNDRFLSVASLWEMVIKTSLGKLTLAEPFHLLIPRQLTLNGIERLSIEIGHLNVLLSLPFHHRDPFDRLLIAQALSEQMPIVSADSNFDAYGVQRLW